MNRQRALAALALIGVIALIVWIARNTYWTEVDVPQPLRGEAATNPFYAAERFARALGARTDRLHGVRELADYDVLVLAGWNWSLVAQRRAAIERWVENGGRLVLDGNTLVSDASLRDWAGLSRVRVEAGGKPVGKADADDVDEHGCGPVQVQHDVNAVSGSRREYRVCTLPVLRAILSEREPLWSLVDAEGYQAVRVHVGRGSVTWLNAQPFLQRDLMDADHGVLFVAATALRAGDAIAFMSEEDQPSLLALMWRHGAPVIVLLLLSLAAALWRHGVRFGPPAPAEVRARRSLAEQIKGTSEFTRRCGGGRALHAAQMRVVNEAAAKRIPRYRSMSREERLAALATMTLVNGEQLAEMLNYTGPRTAHELRRSLALLEHVRRRLDDRRS